MSIVVLSCDRVNKNSLSASVILSDSMMTNTGCRVATECAALLDGGSQ